MTEPEDRILVFNAGSSSLKFQLFGLRSGTPASLLRGVVRDLFAGAASCEWTVAGRKESRAVALSSHADAARLVLDLLQMGAVPDADLLARVIAVGHRIVHGGDSFAAPALIDAASLPLIDSLGALAPLHNPPALAAVGACRERLPGIPMVAAFDTAFFHSLPDYVRAYALPAEWTSPPHTIRRYGFHGLAHRCMAERLAEMKGHAGGRVITLQLGYGCSIAAIRDGRAQEISMGFTPLEGLIMGTRPGDVDAGVLIDLLRRGTLSLDEMSEGLSRRSGLLALSGVSADMRTLLQLESEGHAGARLAIDAFCHRARKYVGAYAAVLGGLDAIVFGGGIGEHAPAIRARICADMAWCGLALDAAANAHVEGREAVISAASSAIAAYVIPVDEEALIAREVLGCLRPARS